VATAGLKVGALFLLVPTYGVMAAAVALPACNAVLVGGIAFVASRIPDATVQYDWPRGVRVVFLSLLLVVPVAALASYSSMLGSSIRLLTVILLPFVLLIGGGLSISQRRRLFASAAALVARLPGGRSFRAVERTEG
jgi:hypothetical protein